MRGRVPPGSVRCDLRRAHQLLSGQPVEQRRLADARRSQQHGRPAGPQVRLDGVEPLARDVRDREDGDADRGALGREHQSRDIRAEVGLRQDDDRLGAALPGGRQIPLEPAQAEVIVEAAEQEDQIDVGSENLVDRVAIGGLAGDRTSPPEDGVDPGPAVIRPATQADPVADRGQDAADRSLVIERAGYLGPDGAVLGPDGVDAAMLRRHAARDQIRLFEALQFGRPGGVPAEGLQG